jgi:hypothetical protein
MHSPEKSIINVCSINNCVVYFHSIEITLPDAVNAVMLKVANCDLHGLGINLGLDSIKVQDVVSHYQLDERRQRLMELWFSQGLGDESLTWEKLREAFPSCEHNGGGSTGKKC